MIREGSLQDFSLPDLLQILVMGNATGTLNLKSEGRLGELYFRDGRLLGARFGDNYGVSAGADLFLWTSGSFDFAEALPAELPEQGPLSVDSLSREGALRLARWKELVSELPAYFSTRAWVYPMQLFQTQKPALVSLLGSGLAFGELARKLGRGELAALEEIIQLLKADQIGLASAPEEQLQQLFERVANALFAQFASISGLKMVEALEESLNAHALEAHVPLRWQAGKVHSQPLDSWDKAQLIAAYAPLLDRLVSAIQKIYGSEFIERVLTPLLEEVPPPQRALWQELNPQPTHS